MRLFLLFILAVAPVFCAGCSSVMSSLAGEWGDSSPDRGMVSAVKVGDNSSTVMNAIGQPQRVEYGEYVYEGWQEWVYETGSVFMYRGRVRQVHAKPLTEEQLLAVKDKNKLLKTERLKLEVDKASNAKLDHEQEQADDKWAFGAADPFMQTGASGMFPAR